MGSKTIANFLRAFFIILFIWFLLCQIHVIYHHIVTWYRNGWIVGRTMEEIEMRYGEPRFREGLQRSIYDRPNCLTDAVVFINRLRIIPFYTGKRYYIVEYDGEGIACWAGYGNRDNAGD